MSASRKETDGQSMRETANRYNFWSVFSSNQLDKWIRKQNNKKSKAGNGMTLSSASVQQKQGRDRGRSNGVIRVGR